MATIAPDLTARARIRNAALELFARDGVAATSIRGVARAAGVSPGLVQHHFPTKEALRSAVNEHVLQVALAAFQDVGQPSDGPDVLDELGERVVEFVTGNATAMRYVARSAIEGDKAAFEVFASFVEIAAAQWERLARDGLLHPDLDLMWAALHTTVINLGGVLFEGPISRHLPGPFLSSEELDRWRLATTAMFRRGLYRERSQSKRAP